MSRSLTLRRGWPAVVAAAALLLSPAGVPLAAADAAPETTIVASADAMVRDGQYGDDNYGGTNTLQWKVGSAGFARQSFVGFDLSAVPAGEIQNASLRLYGRVSGGNPEEWPDAIENQIHQINGAWTESGLTWNTRPAVSQAAIATFVLGGESDQANAWHEVDITEAVRVWPSPRVPTLSGCGSAGRSRADRSSNSTPVRVATHRRS